MFDVHFLINHLDETEQAKGSFLIGRLAAFLASGGADPPAAEHLKPYSNQNYNDLLIQIFDSTDAQLCGSIQCRSGLHR